jgi:hypothetical protein
MFRGLARTNAALDARRVRARGEQTAAVLVVAWLLYSGVHPVIEHMPPAP